MEGKGPDFMKGPDHERTQTEAQPTVPPSNPKKGCFYSFLFLLKVRTRAGS